PLAEQVPAGDGPGGEHDTASGPALEEPAEHAPRRGDAFPPEGGGEHQPGRHRDRDPDLIAEDGAERRGGVHKAVLTRSCSPVDRHGSVRRWPKTRTAP